MKIIFLTSSHFSLDDRIFYHFAMTIVRNGHQILIVSSQENVKRELNSVLIDSFDGNNLSKREKVKIFIEKLTSFEPDRIIASEPLPVWAAHKYIKSQKIKPVLIYDVTEWYPSKKNLTNLSYPKVFFVFFKLLIFNFLSCFYIDKFIFGEYYKSLPYRFLFPFKPYAFLSYYPSLNYLNPILPRKLSSEINLSYSGKLTKEKGFDAFLNVVNYLSVLRPNLIINVKIIGWYVSDSEKNIYLNIIKKLTKNINITNYDILEFHKFIQTIKDTDVFLDLRKSDIENRHCLPIKLFYYLGLNRPIIFTDLKAIRKEVDVSKVGYLVDNEDINLISNLILNYIDNPDLYQNHCRNALEIFNEKYNWELIERNLVKLLA
ncbi:MAG: hypothetical protein EAZ53_09500 [Bacteroidetes bacterium]|nr:MAG: hypothetical protein EAZ53_09500 [Bacteroidota bacterium]